MRAILFHCKEYATEIGRLSNRPGYLSPEEVKEKDQRCEDCVVAFITIEKDDEIEDVAAGLAAEAVKMAKETGRKNIVLVPFAHLSNNIADSKKSIAVFDLIEGYLKDDFNVKRAHFGSHKSLLLNVFGHPGNVRYREF